MFFEKNSKTNYQRGEYWLFLPSPSIWRGGHGPLAPPPKCATERLVQQEGQWKKFFWQKKNFVHVRHLDLFGTGPFRSVAAADLSELHHCGDAARPGPEKHLLVQLGLRGTVHRLPGHVPSHPGLGTSKNPGQGRGPNGVGRVQEQQPIRLLSTVADDTLRFHLPGLHGRHLRWVFHTLISTFNSIKFHHSHHFSDWLWQFRHFSKKFSNFFYIIKEDNGNSSSTSCAFELSFWMSILVNSVFFMWSVDVLGPFFSGGPCRGHGLSLCRGAVHVADRYGLLDPACHHRVVVDVAHRAAESHWVSVGLPVDIV